MLTIHVESTAGSNIVDAIKEMQSLSAKLNVCTEQKINGIITMVFPHSDPNEVFESYQNCVKNGYKVAS